ncbi:MAG: Rrf2 family transcriptional regulator [Hymenobacteraceae bacterium]|nr:Rrf2 family transcriptional regulator [Hymenobacteraceae bacterium]MDX5396450.1 Rrf2 family transcriptional regulator [Hymenobacteraceae bacterium]MDX5442568.1 Rrf2 family transcriptional regulator [Hymenobacteraceae bacterium]MDX5512511.1 Rrf2 family transcriptional regulator [Hymenobacteraceae bacterium]
MLTKTSEYALRSLVYIAMHVENGNKVGIKEIAKELELPMHFVGKILQDLVRKGMIASSKGPHGGFYLSNPASEISIMDVVRLIDGVEAFKRCGLGLKHCSDKHPCPLHNDFKIYRDGLARLFKTKTIQDLVQDIEDGHAFITNVLEKASETESALNVLEK